MKRLAVHSLLACCGIILLVLGANANVQKTFAYITYSDGQIDQYRVSSDGTFVLLTPHRPKVGGLPTRVVTDPAGRFAYVGSYEDKKIAQFRIGEDGTLSPLSPASVPVGSGLLDLTVGRSGNVLYATAKDVRGVLQFAIAEGGKLTPMVPGSVDMGSYGSRVVLHPKRPFLYVTQRTGSLTRARIGPNGGVSGAELSVTTIDGVAGFLTFTKDGNTAFATDERHESLLQYRVKPDGRLEYVGECTYQMEVDNCCGLTTIAIDPRGHSVFVCSDIAGYIYVLNMLPNGRAERRDSEHDYRITRDRRLITRSQYVQNAEARMREARDKVTTTEAVARARDRADANYAALARCRGQIAIPYSITTGPDGAVYILNTSGVARYAVDAHGSLVDGPWAITWPDERTPPSDGRISPPYATRLTIVNRER